LVLKTLLITEASFIVCWGLKRYKTGMIFSTSLTSSVVLFDLDLRYLLPGQQLFLNVTEYSINAPEKKENDIHMLHIDA